MKRYTLLIALFAVTGLVLATGAEARRGQGRGQHHDNHNYNYRWGWGDGYGRLYNPATTESLSGEVIAVEQFTYNRNAAPGVHALVKTGLETISVHLGPAWYIDQQDVKVGIGDSIEAIGSRISYANKPAIIAASVTVGDQTLNLRDSSGVPNWSRRNDSY